MWQIVHLKLSHLNLLEWVCNVPMVARLDKSNPRTLVVPLTRPMIDTTMYRIVHSKNYHPHQWWHDIVAYHGWRCVYQQMYYDYSVPEWAIAVSYQQTWHRSTADIVGSFDITSNVYSVLYISIQWANHAIPPDHIVDTTTDTWYIDP